MPQGRGRQHIVAAQEWEHGTASNHADTELREVRTAFHQGRTITLTAGTSPIRAVFHRTAKPMPGPTRTSENMCRIARHPTCASEKDEKRRPSDRTACAGSSEMIRVPGALHPPPILGISTISLPGRNSAL